MTVAAGNRFEAPWAYAEPPMVERVPLFLLREGRLVAQAGPRQWTPLTRNPEESAKRIKEASGPDAPVYLLDVDGVEAHAPDVSFYQRLERLGVRMWLHPGCRTAEDAMDAFFAGGDTLTVDHSAVGEAGLRELAAIAEGDLHLGLRFRGKGLDPPLRAFDLKRLAGETGIAGIVVDLEAGSDAHQAAATLAELRRHGLPVTVLVREGAAPAGLEASVDRLAVRGP